MRYDILIGLERLLTVTIIAGKMTNDLAAQIVNEERRKMKLKPLRGDDITFLPSVRCKMTEKEIREQQEWQIIVKLTKVLIEKKRREAEGEIILNEIRQRKNILYDI